MNNPETDSEASEWRRLNLLCERDGYESTDEWVLRTREIYRLAICDTDNFATLPRYLPGFKASIHVFDRYLAERGK